MTLFVFSPLILSPVCGGVFPEAIMTYEDVIALVADGMCADVFFFAICFSISVLNMENIDRYKPHIYKLFGVLNALRS